MDDVGHRRARGRVFAAAGGLVALVALTAGAVVALGSSPDRTHAAAPAPTATSPSAASTTTTTVPSTSVSDSATTAAPAAGIVRDGVHSGDLRFFLLPAPKDADVYGDPAGSPLTRDDIASGAADPAASRRALTTYGFRGGAYRTYLTAGGEAEVTIRLARFGSPAKAAAYYASHYYEGKKISLTGGYPARAYHLASGSAESTDTVLAVSYQGDVHLTLTVTGSGTPSRALLQRLLDAEHRRLTTGH
ncbi:hypothetical protein AB0M29_23815 [Streptomyces sp. NPDC051976]|uniref:hypothetical protein n=1 Tax=Streptomyces sp. NPDC051976 TaxID=3154947 RepID=UPI003431125E